MHLIKICQAETCRRNFAEASLKRAEELLKIKAGETTANGKIKLESCGCLSNCDFGPNVLFMENSSPLLNIMQAGTVENHMTPDRLERKIRSLLNPQNS